ncbi:hypothetical protein BD410DRAFT_896770 [Rickenella mellea]|uniref:Uncharacterized protein n=1 Tax=Rickenella mellea TaxID=50990 RepID=A0A4Y7QBH9_9AGAM|nr:hypothetical protein BD410DRAFT_896770 [Rickenella mellea]
MPGVLSKTPADTQWSFNLRCGDYDDSESDDDTDPPSTTSESSDARLIKELDFGSREDTAVFKANPWSIARVNAASRPQNVSGPQYGQQGQVQTTQKNGAKLRGPIVDGFEKQAATAKPRVRSSSTNLPTPKGSSPILGTVGRSPILEGQNVLQRAPPLFANMIATTRGSSQTSHLYPNTYKKNSNYPKHSAIPQDFSSPIRQDVTRTPICASVGHCTPTTTTDHQNLSQASPNSGRDLTPQVSATYRIPASPWSQTTSPATSLNDSYPKSNVSSTFSTKAKLNIIPTMPEVSPPVVSHSSPVTRFPSTRLFSPSTSQVKYQPTTLTPKSSPLLGDVRPNTLQSNLRNSPFHGNLTLGSPLRSVDDPNFGMRGGHDPPRYPTEYPKWLMHSLPQKTDDRGEIQNGKIIYDLITEDSPIRELTPVDRVSNLPDTDNDTSDRLRAEAFNVNACTSTPNSLHRATSHYPSPQYPKMGPGVPLISKPKRDAYDAFTSDDDTWSTLPSRKKQKSGNANNGIKQSGRFRIPLAIPRNTQRTETESKNGAVKKRVISYNPPPLDQSSTDATRGTVGGKSAVVWKVTRICNPTDLSSFVSEEKREDSQRRPNRGNDGLHSAAHGHSHVERSVSPRSSSKDMDRATFPRNREQDTHDEEGWVDSSDVREVEDDDDDATLVPTDSSSPTTNFCASVTLDHISQAYPALRLKIAERKRAAGKVWNLLGLPSCGMVYQDGCGDRDGPQEMGISVWT